MRSWRPLRHATIAPLLLAGCSVVAPPDPRLCAAAQNLSAALALTATAITADEASDLARAQGLATEARSVGELAQTQLQSVSGEDRRHATWQALFDAYVHVGQAANSVLPAYSPSHGTGPAELAEASTSMAKARGDLPAMCFDVPADLETPAPS